MKKKRKGKSGDDILCRERERAEFVIGTEAEEEMENGSVELCCVVWV